VGQVFRDCPECPDMVVIPAGRFDMGSALFDPERSPREGPQHRVDLPTFALAKTELTRGQFAVFMQATGYRTRALCRTYEQGEVELRLDRHWRNPGYAQNDSHPVVCLGKEDAQAYLQWLSKQTGKHYRLPSEAEWEYAARAATEHPRFWEGGANAACQYANVGDQATQQQVPGGIKAAHACNDAYAYTAPVASFKPNAFGLYDMIGNVSEWVEDCWHEDYSGAPSDGRAWSSKACEVGIVRGGAWSDEPQIARAVSRRNARVSRDVSTFDAEIGFRPAMELP
jgi:formylglycine-generating enzyme required for sulfatase activity